MEAIPCFKFGYDILSDIYLVRFVWTETWLAGFIKIKSRDSFKNDRERGR